MKKKHPMNDSDRYLKLRILKFAKYSILNGHCE